MTPFSRPRRASPSSPEYTVTPLSQRHKSPDYTPGPGYKPAMTPSQRSRSQDYTPATVNYTPWAPSGCRLPDYFHDMEHHCASPSTCYSQRTASPEYKPVTPVSRPRCASSPEYIPSSPGGVKRRLTHVSAEPPPLPPITRGARPAAASVAVPPPSMETKRIGSL